MNVPPNCIRCGSNLYLVQFGVLNYSWRCVDGCKPDLDTGVPATIDISAFERYAICDGKFRVSSVVRPLPAKLVAGVKVYMPQILYHFIECTWGGCFNSIYKNCLVPHLDSPEVVDYVLRTPVVKPCDDLLVGDNGARVYGELMSRLQGISSLAIADYLSREFHLHC